MIPIERIERIAGENPALLDAMFTSRERGYATGATRFEHLAACFAGKEAILKALGTGLARGIDAADVEIVHERSGHPEVRLHGPAEEAARGARLLSIDVSLTHAGGIAAASAVAIYAGD